jgi:hypothetical protein
MIMKKKFLQEGTEGTEAGKEKEEFLTADYTDKTGCSLNHKDTETQRRGFVFTGGSGVRRGMIGE